MLRITATSVMAEFNKRGIPCEVIDEDRSILHYQKDGKSYFLRGAISAQASATGVLVADNKAMSDIVARELGLRVPETTVYNQADTAEDFLNTYTSLVVKPVGGAHGKGVTVNVTSNEKLNKAIEYARASASDSDVVILQQQVEGSDIRVLVIGYAIAAACLRIPASVVGDGIHTIEELITQENLTNPKRGKNYTTELNYIDMTAAKGFLGEAIHEIPGLGIHTIVCGTANIGTGGVSEDITDQLPTEVAEDAIRIARRMGLPVCGVDFMTTDVSKAADYYLIEINSSPSFGLHLRPSVGIKRDVTKLFVDYLMEDV